MAGMKRRVTLHLDEREWEALERRAAEWGTRLSALIGDIVLSDLEIPEDLWTEEEKRNKYKYEMYYENGNFDDLRVAIKVYEEVNSYYDRAYDEDEYYCPTIKEVTAMYDHSEKALQFDEEEDYSIKARFNRLLAVYGEEIHHFAATLQVGKKVVNGVVEDDEENPNVTKEQIDWVFDQIVKLHILKTGTPEPFFYFINTTNIVNDDFWGLEENRVFHLYIMKKGISKMKTNEPLEFEDFYCEIGSKIEEKIGYPYIKQGKEVYPYFKKRMEEEIIPKIIATREFKALKMAQLFE